MGKKFLIWAGIASIGAALYLTEHKLSMLEEVQEQHLQSCADCEESRQSLYEENQQLRQELLVIAIEKCESTFRHENIWGKAKEYGAYQFKEQTFNWMAEKAGIDGLNWKNREDQETLIRWALENNKQRHWTCYNKALDMYPILREE